MNSPESVDCLDFSESAELFAGGDLAPEDAERMRQHLDRCDSCNRLLQSSSLYQELLSGVESLSLSARSVAKITAAFRRHAGSWAEYSEYSEWIGDLLDQPSARRSVMISNGTKYRSPGFSEFLSREAFLTGWRDPQRSLRLGQLAIEIATEIAGNTDNSQDNAELLVHAWLSLANTKRVTSDLNGAEACFNSARRAALLANLEDTPIWADYLRLRGNQRGSQRRFAEAQSDYAKAIDIYGRQSLGTLEGRTTIYMGSQLGEEGKLVESIAALEKGLELTADLPMLPRETAEAKHNILIALIELGRIEDARILLPEVRTLHAELQEPILSLRLRWVEAQMAVGCGELDEAEREFTEIKREFLDREMPYDAALASLHLVDICLRQGRLAEVAPLVAEMLAVFRSLRIPRESIAAMVLLQKAVEVERLTAELVKEAVAYFQKARSQPGLRFRPQDW